jgi:hypothetical protein
MIHLDYGELKKKISRFFRYTQSGKKRICSSNVFIGVTVTAGAEALPKPRFVL